MRSDTQAERQMDNMKTAYPTINKVCTGYKRSIYWFISGIYRYANTMILAITYERKEIDN